MSAGGASQDLSVLASPTYGVSAGGLRRPRRPNPRARCRRLFPSPTGRYSRRLRGGVGIKGLRSPRRDESATGPELRVPSVRPRLHHAVLTPPGIQNVHSRAGFRPRGSTAFPPAPAPAPAARRFSHRRRRPRLCRLARPLCGRGAARDLTLRKAQPLVRGAHGAPGFASELSRGASAPLLPLRHARALRRARARAWGSGHGGGFGGASCAEWLSGSGADASQVGHGSARSSASHMV